MSFKISLLIRIFNIAQQFPQFKFVKGGPPLLPACPRVLLTFNSVYGI